jgi:hypothetical protein
MAGFGGVLRWSPITLASLGPGLNLLECDQFRWLASRLAHLSAEVDDVRMVCREPHVFEDLEDVAHVLPCLATSPRFP